MENPVGGRSGCGFVKRLGGTGRRIAEDLCPSRCASDPGLARAAQPQRPERCMSLRQDPSAETTHYPTTE